MSTDPSELRIVHYPHDALRRKARPIGEITDEIREIARRMLELMHEAEGVGLAAAQVALPLNMFVANPTGLEDEREDRVYINPTLRDPEGEPKAREEGCLSVPKVYGDVWRAPQISIDAVDLDHQPFTMTSNDLLARIWQHECDHLAGRLIIDRFGQMAKLANRRALKELEAAARENAR